MFCKEIWKAMYTLNANILCKLSCTCFQPPEYAKKQNASSQAEEEQEKTSHNTVTCTVVHNSWLTVFHTEMLLLLVCRCYYCNKKPQYNGKSQFKKKPTCNWRDITSLKASTISSCKKSLISLAMGCTMVLKTSKILQCMTCFKWTSCHITSGTIWWNNMITGIWRQRCGGLYCNCYIA